jgi:surface protein
MPAPLIIITDDNIHEFINNYFINKSKLPSMIRNLPIGKWDVSRVTNMSSLFEDADFNEDISEWNVSNVVNMSNMFKESYFNGSIENWNVSKVENMSGMFDGTYKFNQPLNGWGNKTANVKDMTDMFYLSRKFNQPLNNWNVSNVQSMAHMFDGAWEFNQPLNGWGNKTANVKDMTAMFYLSPKFNQPLNNWNVSNVQSMAHMFDGAKQFNQDLYDWQIADDVNVQNMFTDAPNFDMEYLPRRKKARNEIDMRIDRLINLKPYRLKKSNMTILPTDTVFDLLEGEDVNAIEFLKQDANNIVFKHKTKCYGINREDLVKAIKDQSNIFYGCFEPDTPYDSEYKPILNNIAKSEPCFRLHSIGINIGGLLIMAELKNILIGSRYNAFEIVEQPIDMYNETVSLYSINMDDRENGEPSRMTNSRHCDPGSSENVYRIKFIAPRVSGGYKKQTRYKRNKSKRRKTRKHRKTTKK